MALLTVKFEIDEKVNSDALRDLVQRFNDGETGETGTLKFEGQEFDFENIESMALGPNDDEDDEDSDEDDGEAISASAMLMAPPA